MADFVVKVPLGSSEEDQLFGAYFSRFIESRSGDADTLASKCDAPYVMVRSDPTPERLTKTVIFQERRAAAAFSSGWAEARRTIAHAA